MAVLRIVPDLHAEDPQALAAFYTDVFGIEISMDAGFVVTMSSGQPQSSQVTFGREGGSDTELPAISVEVDALEPVLEALTAKGIAPVYGPVDEPWGVRRFYFRDPAGHLINVLKHSRRPHARLLV